jgi:hypothetical protein
MAVTRYSGPIMAPGSGGNPPLGDYNDTPGPSGFAHGVGLVDTRYFPGTGADVTALLPLWYSTSDIVLVDQAPSTLSAVNLIPAAVPVSGTAMTLAVASTGITVVPTGGFTLGGQYPTVLAAALVIDSNPAILQLAQLAGGVSMFDPRHSISRNVRVTAAGDETGNTFTVVGADIYGVPMHETITLGTAAVYSGKKAFKFIVSGTANGTLSGSNISMGTGDVYGFPLASWDFDLTIIRWNAIVALATTGYTAALALATPSTATTADVRGTYAVQTTASDGTRKLVVRLTPAPWALTQAGIFGNVQF